MLINVRVEVRIAEKVRILAAQLQQPRTHRPVGMMEPPQAGLSIAVRLDHEIGPVLRGQLDEFLDVLVNREGARSGHLRDVGVENLPDVPINF